MKVAIYLQTASSPLKHKILECFGKGIERIGEDKVVYIEKFKIVPSDMAIILGFYGRFAPAKNDPTHNFRKKIYEYQIKRNKNIMFIDRDFFCDIGKKVENQLDPHHFFRVSMGSIYFNEGIHFNHNKLPQRWRTIKQLKQIEEFPKRKSSDNILVCLNNGEFGKSWATKTTQMMPWALKTIEEIRKYSDKKIVLRFHPKIKPHLQGSIPINIFNHIDNLYFSGGIRNKDSRVLKDRTIDDDILNAHVSVYYNSSASILPALYGFPIIDLGDGPVVHLSYSLSDIKKNVILDQDIVIDTFNRLLFYQCLVKDFEKKLFEIMDFHQSSQSLSIL